MREAHKKPGITVAISVLVGALVCPLAVFSQGQYFDSTGKPVTKEQYDAVMLMNEGSQLLHDNKVPEAVFRLERAAQMAPQMPDIHYNYGIGLAKMGRTEEAAQQFDEATRLNPSMASAWMNLGASYQMLGKIEEAVRAYREFVNRFPDNPEAGKVSNLIQGLAKESSRQAGGSQGAISHQPVKQSPPVQAQQAPPQQGGWQPVAQQPKMAPQPAAQQPQQQSGSPVGLSGWQPAAQQQSQPPQSSQIGLSGWQPGPQPQQQGFAQQPQQQGFMPQQQQQGFVPQQQQQGFVPQQQQQGFAQQPQQQGFAQQPQQQGFAQQSQQQGFAQQPQQQGFVQQPQQQGFAQQPQQQGFVQQQQQQGQQIAMQPGFNQISPQMQGMGAQTAKLPAKPAAQPNVKAPVKPVGKPPQNQTPIASAQQPAMTPGAQSQNHYLEDIGGARLGRWPSNRMPLKVYIEPANNLPGFRPSFDQILIKCFQDWAKASGNRISFKGVADKKDSDIECSWTADTAKFMNSAEAGETIVYGSKAGIHHCTIQILTVPHPMSQTVPVTDARMRWICLHEIGHALGLGGHTRNPQDIMFYTAPIAEQWKELTERDASTVARLYSAK